MKYLNIFSFLLIITATQSCLSADEDPVAVPPITGSIVDPQVNGARQPNQVWIDLSDMNPETKKLNQTVNLRTDWDLGFYSGDEYRVILNSSVAMAVAKIPNATDINKVKEADVKNLMNTVQVGPFGQAVLQYIDNPDGNFLTQTTGIAPVKDNDAENPVYLLNLGRKLDTGSNIPPGSVSLSGDSRGWKKIQIVRAPGGYKIRYADIDATEYKEYIITKDPDYTFSFFSFTSGTTVKIQPEKKKWDLGFTTFTNEVFMGTASAGSYFYADFVITNTAAGVSAYQVNVTGSLDQAYKAFKRSDVDAGKFISNDQRAIGDKWRTTTGTAEIQGAFVYTDRFFVIKDAAGFYFKLRFNKMKNVDGERGYPNFVFDPL
ncbi:HmuY family protein [Chryseobacterium gallinarum]|uniref:HmuY family protein n=1 Tax=Chryseobacterium gallinarum TaxID=1324352 RepID=UPI00202437CE|nr:HmuY family protein [Chryseobacterium gallinarum]MCL8537439.1 HmuY family protein [Chryseobacterium gallinarum]